MLSCFFDFICFTYSTRFYWK